MRLGRDGEEYAGIRKDTVHVGGRITLVDDARAVRQSDVRFRAHDGDDRDDRRAGRRLRAAGRRSRAADDACSTPPRRGSPTLPAAREDGAADMHVAAIIVAGGQGRARSVRDQRRSSSSISATARTMLDPQPRGVLLACRAGRRRSSSPCPPAARRARSVDGPARREADRRSSTGGARRQDSVANAFARVSDAADLVVIHDAARPFVTAATDRAHDPRGRASTARRSPRCRCATR